MKGNEPISKLVGYHRASFLQLICPSILLSARSMGIEPLSTCKLYTTDMALGGGQYSLPMTDLCTSRVVAICEPKFADLIDDSFFHLTLNDKHAYGGWRYITNAILPPDVHVQICFVSIIIVPNLIPEN